MKLLFVGDPHAEPHDLDDCRNLTELIERTVSQQKPDVLLLAGDLYHTHAIIHAEVQLFWWKFFNRLHLLYPVETIVLKGNHDAPTGTDTKATALLAHATQVVAVLYEPVVRDRVLFCPYTTRDQLVAWSKEFAACQTLVCHQTFDGSKYDNGFFAGDGVDPADIVQCQIVSGHIHRPQEFGKVWYPGAPRWRVRDDANHVRGVWVLTFTDGKLSARERVDTGDTCRRIFDFEDTPEFPMDELDISKKDEFHVTVRGPRAWIEERLPLYKGCRVRTVATDSASTAKVRESDGVSVAFGKWLDEFQPKHGTDKAVLKQMVGERLGIK